MPGNTLHCIAKTEYNIIYHMTIRYSPLPYTTIHYNRLPCIAILSNTSPYKSYNIFQYTARLCNTCTLHYITICYIALHCFPFRYICIYIYIYVHVYIYTIYFIAFLSIAKHYNSLQYVTIPHDVRIHSNT